MRQQQQQQGDSEMEKPRDEEQTPPPTKDEGPGPPPDGGLMAWSQVLGGFMLFFNTWGILKCVQAPALFKQQTVESSSTDLVNQHIRRLPDLLRKRPTLDLDKLRHLLDRLHPIANGARRRSNHRTRLRQRISPIPPNHRHLWSRLRSYDALALYNILAVALSPGVRDRYWWGMSLRPRCRYPT